MPEDNMPPLPPSQMHVEVWDSEVTGLHGANAAYYTADQLREYGALCARLAREQEREEISAILEAAHGFDKHGVAAAIHKGAAG